MKLILLFLFALGALALPFHPSAAHQHKLHKKLERLQQQKESQGARYPQPQFFDQQLVDHFNGQDQRNWSQRYFINDTFFNPDLGGPIFFQVGGEGAISAGYVVDLMMVHYGQQEGALLVALEHRFYGESHPFPEMTTANLGYLSSQQALADAAYFISFLKTKYPTATDVITFGGSYPGSLAAWFRIKYPHITKGAVASSAPVQAELDMVQYLDVVGESLSKVSGITCDRNIQAATTIIQNMLSSGSGRGFLTSKFNTCSGINTDKDVATFMSNLMGNWMGVVQYNAENPSSPTIAELCAVMENETITDVFDRYVQVSNMFLNGGCMDVSYDDMIKGLQNTTDFGANGVGNRQWTYQTCLEFGYFQSTDSTNQPFGNLVPVSYYTDICKDAFGFDFLPHISATNTEYGAKNPGGTNILFVNGSIDPWHSLSIIKSLSDTILAIYIQGTAHCANMELATPTDPPGLAIAQQQTATIIHQWLVSQ